MKRLNLLMIPFVTLLVLVMVSSASAAVVSTDHEDYCPEETVLISGTGFTPYAVVQIAITRPDGVVDTGSTQADETGAFSNYAYVLDGIEGTYTVDASDGQNTAQTTFTDCFCRCDVWTYGDSGYTTLKDEFYPGETIYYKAISSTKGVEVRIKNPGGTIVHTNKKTDAKELRGSYVLPSDAQTGTWTIETRCRYWTNWKLCKVKTVQLIPEFTTIAIPVVAIIGLLFFFNHRKQRNA